LTLIRPLLQVRVHDQNVGRILLGAEGRRGWEPDSEWIDARGLPRLGYEFAVDPDSPRWGTGTLPAWFENLLPEPESALRSHLCSIHGVALTDSASLLAILGDDLPGAVTIHPITERGSADGPTGTASNRHDSTHEAPDPLDGWRFSLAGMQLKFSMLRVGNRYVLPAKNEHGRYILKLPGPGLPELAEVEASTMEWGRLSGLRVPPVEVVEMSQVAQSDPSWAKGHGNALAIERFDRLPDGGRVHQEDFAQALGVASTHKYGDSGAKRWSYDGLARFVADVAGESGAEEFVRRLAFVIGSGNSDAHLKNWSLQWLRDGSARLSPCYDLVATVSWPDFGWGLPRGPRLALGFGKNRRFNDLDSAVVRRFVRRSGLAHAEDLLMESLRRCASTWDHVASSAPPRMAAALREHWSRVPLLRTLGGIAS
jgi:serine/threonine-protein kinase HipA